MNATIINLAKETERLNSLIKNIMDCKIMWQFTIFKAYEIDDLANHSIPNTSISPGLVSLGLGHKNIVKSNMSSNNHLIIIEDDIEFNISIESSINKAISQLDETKTRWDILFTDVTVPILNDMLKLIQYKINNKNEPILIDLSKFHFAGTTCVIINNNSIHKYYELLNIDEFFLHPIDLYIKKLVHEKKLKAFCTFPFVTSPSRHADKSSIQSAEVRFQNLLWNEFRRTMCIQSDQKEIQSHINSNILNNLDDATFNVLQIIGANFINSINLLK